MIYSRFGPKVRIIRGDIEKGEVDIERVSDGKVTETYINELKATDGIDEIIKAIEAANKVKE